VTSNPAEYGLTYEQAMEQIHGVLPSGAVVRGMEVFRRAYAAVGWGWLLAPTAWPLLRPLFDRGYQWFARNRLRLTGRWCGVRVVAQLETRPRTLNRFHQIQLEAHRDEICSRSLTSIAVLLLQAGTGLALGDDERP